MADSQYADMVIPASAVHTTSPGGCDCEGAEGARTAQELPTDAYGGVSAVTASASANGARPRGRGRGCCCWWIALAAVVVVALVVSDRGGGA